MRHFKKLIIEPVFINFASIDSTHFAARRIVASLEKCYILTADRQTAGVGKIGNKWESPLGNLYVSIRLPYSQEFNFLSLLTACALHSVLANLLNGQDVKLHWPNDIYVGGKKIAGILLDSLGDGMAIISFGINTNVLPAVKNREIAKMGKFIDNQNLLKFILESINEWHQIYTNNRQDIISYWRKKVLGIGGEIMVKCGEMCEKGTFREIDDHGRIVLLRDNDKEVRISTGDVFVNL